MERYFVALDTSTGIISGTIIGDFDAGIKDLIKQHNAGNVTAILKIEQLPPVPDNFKKEST